MDSKLRAAGPPDAVENAPPDLLSDVLDALRIDSSALFVFEFSAPWGVRVSGYDQAFSWTVVEGGFWLSQPNREPMRFNAGDTFILTRGTGTRSYDFLSALEVAPFPAADLWREARLPWFEPGSRLGRPRVLRWGAGGGMTRIVSTSFAFEDRLLGPLVQALPDLMVVRGDEAGSHFVDLLLRLPVGTQADDAPGFAAIATQTARLLLVHVVRTYALSLGGGQGWLGGLSDPKISQALVCMHREPSRNWTVAALAAQSGMSRSLFAKRFHETVGDSPMRYLCAWRIHLAREILAVGETTVTRVANDLGYSSETAFRAAFRRVTGQLPRTFRRAVKLRST